MIGPLSLAHFVPLGTDDWMGYDHSAETILAHYTVGGKDETLLITSYPTQQVAAAEFAGILRRFTFDPPDGVPCRAERALRQARQFVYRGRRRSSLARKPPTRSSTRWATRAT